MKVAIYREGYGSVDRVTFEGAERERLDAAGEVSFLRAAAEHYVSYRGIAVDDPEDALEWDGRRLVVEPIDEDAVEVMEWDRDEEGLHRCVDLRVEVSVEVSAVALPRRKPKTSSLGELASLAVLVNGHRVEVTGNACGGGPSDEFSLPGPKTLRRSVPEPRRRFDLMQMRLDVDASRITDWHALDALGRLG